ncbi:MAG: response regulator [Planctomycetes bacterium]|nr:response regulator [Planctomycetota bacterium]
MICAKNTQVLIVDDEPDLCELVEDALRGQGFGVSCAGSGAEACALAERTRPDMLIADLRLPDCSGLDVIDHLRERLGEMPAIVITGSGDIHSAVEAWRRGCIDFLTKPLDLPRLRQAIDRELRRRRQLTHLSARNRKLHVLARELNRQRHGMKRRLDTTCTALTTAYRTLSSQFNRQEALLRVQGKLLACRSDDDVFRAVFSCFAERSESLFGVAMVCNEDANLQMVGRFGTPLPDSASIGQAIGLSLLDIVLQSPLVMRLSLDTHASLFPQWLHQHLEGVEFLCLPLLPSEGQLIGLCILYLKNGESFTDTEVALGELLAPVIAMSIQANGTEVER